MTKYLILGFFLLLTSNANSQLLKKLKEKVVSNTEQKIQDKVEKKADASVDSLLEGNVQLGKRKAPVENPQESDSDGGNRGSGTGSGSPNLKVYSKFDFVPGTTILYFDNFEKDNIGETPEGWITSTFSEVVTIEGLEGNWLKMGSTSSKHFIRSKKQSWGNNFTVEFDLLIVKNSYDPRIDINLVNTGGNLVTDESILIANTKSVINFSAIIGAANQSRASLSALDKRLSDVMTENLPYGNTVPVHVSMCVQGKRFRMWWNERKLYDLSAVSEEYVPNQLEFEFGHLGGTDYYISNIRVARDIPDTRAKFEEGKLVSNLLFYSGTDKLKPESMGSLLDVSKVLKDATSAIKIIGHTDSDGDEASNLLLSQQRAETVKNTLINQYNISEEVLTTEGRGETQPIADNNSVEGKAQNRRVEFIFKAGADTYTKPVSSTTAANPVSARETQAPASSNASSGSASSVAIQSKVLNTSLPYAQFMKTGESSYTFIASKEEGNSRDNFIKVQLESVYTTLKPETYNFKIINQTNPLYGSKKFAEITKTEASLNYGTGKKPYISQLSPINASGHMATFYSESLEEKLPSASPNYKFVIEKVADGKASGYFLAGAMIEGLQPITKGDAMTQTFTNGFAGEIRFTFTDVPIY